jgi:YegS/Rv2252/BmrU family lipid kinase
MNDQVRGAYFERKECLIIVNPKAHQAPRRRYLLDASEWLESRGWRVNWAETSAAGDATRFTADAAAAGIPLVFVCGGDGTLNESVNGLAGSDTTMGVIPAGTVNLWARELHTLKPPLDSVQSAVLGERRRIDLGKAGDRYFLLMASYGVDASVTHHVSPRVKGYMGATAYGIAAAKEALTFSPVPIEVTLDNEVRWMQVLMVLAGNTQLYAGFAKVAPDAKVDDGLLDVCIYQGRGKPEILAHATRTLFRLHTRSRNVVYRRVKRLHLAWEQPLPLQLDGDPYPASPSEIVAVPAALSVLVPRGVKTSLFSR